MKKISVLFLALLLLTSAVLSVSAITTPASVSQKADTLPHNHPYRHKNLMVWDCPPTTETPRSSIQMSEAEMEKFIANVDPARLNHCVIQPGHISQVESREITCEYAPFVVTFRVWGTGANPVMVFYKSYEKDSEWDLLECYYGPDITVEFPEDGYYAVAKAW